MTNADSPMTACMSARKLQGNSTRKPAWYTDLEQAKKEAEAKGIQDWKSLCKSQPPKLDPKLKAIISEMYMAAANEMTGRKLFDAPKLQRGNREVQAIHEGISMLNDKIKQVIKKYNPEEIRIGVLGSHSALEIASGAKQEGLRNRSRMPEGQRKNLHKILQKPI